MAVMGDSISYGTFANSGVKGLVIEKPKPEPWYRQWLFKLTAFPQNNWACGTNVNSHLMKLRKSFPDQTWECNNLSVPGSTIEDVASLQAPKAVSYKPDYLLIEIGGNNICHADTPAQMTSVYTMALNLKSILDQVKDGNRAIMIVGLPDISALHEVLKDKHNIIGLSANRVWGIMHECDIATNGKYVKEIRQRVAEYNLLFQSFATGTVLFGKGTANIKFAPGDISAIDLFHPSKQGQQMLSDANSVPSHDR